MENSRQTREKISRDEIGEKTRTPTLHCIGQTVSDLNAAARRAVAVTPGAIVAAKTICDRALMQREAGHPPSVQMRTHHCCLT